MEEIIRGRVFERSHVLPALRQTPHVGDVVVIKAGKYAGRAGKVSGWLEAGDGKTYHVMRDDGVIIGQYPLAELTIIMEGS